MEDHGHFYKSSSKDYKSRPRKRIEAKDWNFTKYNNWS